MNSKDPHNSKATEAVLRHEIETLKRELSEARSANAAKEAFLSSMSHDIRTPMNAIIGMTALARKHIDEKSRVLDALSKIDTAGAHLLGLINDVLDMSRINSGRMKLTPAPFAVSDLLHDLQIIVRPQMDQKHHSWRLSAEKIEQEILIGDALRLRQIYVNIISNAVKYTPSGGRIESCFSEETEDGRCSLLFRCEDNGIGMTPEFLSRIFEPFERAESSATGGIEGTGLGMSIVRSLVQAMDGDIQIDSEHGRGTAVSIRIPLAFDPQTPDFSFLEGRRLLILESDPRQRELFQRYLTGTGAVPVLVSSASEALSGLTDASFQDQSFDLAVLGLTQEQSGSPFDTAAYLHKAHPRLPLALAAEDDWEKIEYQANRSGIQTFIPLPFFRKSLLSGLITALRGGSEAAAPEIPDLSGKRILLVEDNLINREIAGEILSTTQAAWDAAENGRQAVDCFTASPAGTYSLILMDIQMPVLDGYAAARAIRSSGHEDASVIPIYAMTANTFAEDVAKALAAGMNGHLAKPIDMNALMRVLSSIR